MVISARRPDLHSISRAIKKPQFPSARPQSGRSNGSRWRHTRYTHDTSSSTSMGPQSSCLYRL